MRSNRGFTSEKFLDAIIEQGKRQNAHQDSIDEQRQWQKKYIGQKLGVTVTCHGIEDTYGNLLFSLPVQEPTNFEEWLSTELKTYFEYSE